MRPDPDPSSTPRSGRRRPLALLSSWLAFAALAVVVVPHALADVDRLPGADRALQRGAEVYAFHCSTCHGATGLGFEEARAAFPSDHAACSRCHVPSNPPQMSSRAMEQQQTAFSLGDPPPLAHGERLERFSTAGALYRYVRATMPRWSPGSLTDESYGDVTLYVLHQAGLLDAATTDDERPPTAEPLVDLLDRIVLEAD